MNRPVNIIQTAQKVLKEEAACIEALQPYVNESFEKTIHLLSGCSGRIIITGIGKSAIVGQKITATLNSTGTPAIFMHASEAVHGDLGMILENDTAWIISNSGNSPEIKGLVPTISNFGNPIIAMTGNADSFLAQNATHLLLTPVTREACGDIVAPTSSTTAQMAMGDAVATVLMQLKGFTNQDFARLHPGGKLGKQLNLHVSDIYTQNSCPSVSSDTSLKDVINTISQGRLGASAVIDSDKKVIGIITDGDVRRMLQKVDVLSGIKAADILTPMPKTIAGNALAVEALEIMRHSDITQLIAVDSAQHFLGFVHIHDLIREGL